MVRVSQNPPNNTFSDWMPHGTPPGGRHGALNGSTKVRPVTSTTWTGLQRVDRTVRTTLVPDFGSTSSPPEGLPEIPHSTALLMSMLPQAPNQSCPPPFGRHALHIHCSACRIKSTSEPSTSTGCFAPPTKPQSTPHRAVDPSQIANFRADGFVLCPMNVDDRHLLHWRATFPIVVGHGDRPRKVSAARHAKL